MYHLLNRIFWILLLCCISSTSLWSQIELSADTIKFSSEAQNSTIIQIKSKSNKSWTFQSSSPWIRVDRLLDNLAISTTSANDTIVPRSTSIEICCEKYSKNIFIIQSSSEKKIDAAPSLVVFPNDGGTKEITIEANCPWKIVSLPQWCHIVIAGNVIKVTALSNTGKKSKTDKLIVKGGDVKTEVLLKQRGSGLIESIQGNLEEGINNVKNKF